MASSTAAATGRKRKAETTPEPPDEQEKAPRITAKMEEEVQCPICLEVPLGEIIQCGNGCTVCQPCQEKTGRDTCGQCRGRMKTPEGVWIRSRTLEKMLDQMVIPCRFHDKGCTQVLPRGELHQHLEECDKSGNFIRICRYFPGGDNCDFKIKCTKPQEAIQHLRDHHNGIAYGNQSLNVGWLRNKSNYPVSVTLGGVECLLVVSTDLDDDTLQFLALRLDQAEERIRMKITIKSPTDGVEDLKVEIPVVPFLEGPAALQKRRLVRFSKSTLEQEYKFNVTGKIKLVINIIN